MLVSIGSTYAPNVGVQPGGESTTVTVDASSSTVKTESSDVAGNVGGPLSIPYL